MLVLSIFVRTETENHIHNKNCFLLINFWQILWETYPEGVRGSIYLRGQIIILVHRQGI